MAQEKVEKVESLESYLLNAGLDLTLEKPTLMNNENGLDAAATAWQTSENGIRAVLESRAMELRQEILFKCKPFEMLALRERLVELASVISLFKSAVSEAERRAKAKDAEEEQQFDITEQLEEDTVGDKSSM